VFVRQVKLFGGPRLTKYVAEENVGEVDEQDIGKGIQHQALVNYFEGFSPSGFYYKPRKKLIYEYAQDEQPTYTDFVSL
jgi:hypothetical protein